MDPSELLRRGVLGQRVQHMRLRPADARGDQGGDMTVAAVLAQQGGRVPEPGDGLLGERERPQRGVQDPPLRGRAGRRLGGEVGGAGKTGGVGEVAEDPPQRRDAALLASGERRLGSGRVPDAGDVAGDLTLGEVVEDRMDHLGRNSAQRRRPPGKVAIPVVPQAERHERIGRLVRKVGDQVDRLHEPVQTAGDDGGHANHGLHPDHLLRSDRRPSWAARSPLLRTALLRGDTCSPILFKDFPAHP